MRRDGMYFKGSFIKRIIGGLGVGALCAILGAMLVTTFVLSGLVNAKNMGACAAIVMFVSALLAALYVKVGEGKGCGGKILILTGCTIIALLLINVIAYDGEFHGLVLKISAILVGSFLMLLRLRDKPKKYGKAKNR